MGLSREKFWTWELPKKVQTRKQYVFLEGSSSRGMADIVGPLRPSDSWSTTEVRSLQHSHVWTIRGFSQCECRYLETSVKIKETVRIQKANIFNRCCFVLVKCLRNFLFSTLSLMVGWNETFLGS